MARSEFKRLVDHDRAGRSCRRPKNIYECRRARALLGDQVNFITVVFLTKDKVPGEVGH